MSEQSVATAPPAGKDEHRQSPPALVRLRILMHDKPILGPLVVLVLSLVVFSLLADNFLSAGNLSLITQQVMVIGIAGLGQTIIILTAGIDLSAGAVAVFSAIVMAKAATDLGLPGPLAILVGLLCGGVCGALNGALVVRFRLPPFIATLGTLSVFYALGLYLSGGATIRGTDMPAIMTAMGKSFSLFGTNVSYGAVLLVVLVAVVSYCLLYTSWGRHVHAVGDDVQAAGLTGIRTGRVLISVYIVAGVLYGIAAWVLIGRTGAASPQSASTLNLDSITAAVIGGASLFGGRGRVLGTFVGALIVGVFRNGLALAGVQVLWQDFAVGLLIVGAVALDQWIRKGSR
ncbi:ABC transporter permease [Nakamurella leprariae]|uniref:Autoinducer 2 import system permease protein LsrD n=1 Tax=Nakamurella leprariae TaxID=2803911 RepID=A0A939BZ72_9ACTN|nr:ABC transporter permease [Nakamurella leprariae]MBM9467845.1 ABC transporter permease [Nakamurella leprariae]